MCIEPNQKYGLSAGRPKTARPKGKVRKGMSKTSEAEITLLESVWVLIASAYFIYIR